MKEVKTLMLYACLFALLAACGGGGGSGGNSNVMPDPAPPPPPAPSEDELREEYAAHFEFQNQPALERINAHYAYARGATGAGVTVGIVDSGIDGNHPEFSGKLSPESWNISGYDPDYNLCTGRNADGTCGFDAGPPSHGSLVGGVLAANRTAGADTPGVDVPSIHGVAFDARLLSVGLPLSDPPDVYAPIDLQDSASTTGIDQLFADITSRLNPSVTVINLSIGLQGNIEAYNEAEIRAAFPLLLESIAQAERPAAERAIYVWSAGNAQSELRADGSLEQATSVEIMAGLPALVPALQGHSLAVVSLKENGEISDFSNRCGIAQDFCLAAPGENLIGPVPNIFCPAGQGDCYAQASGTSLAAPLVSGGVALLAQHYRNQLGNDEITSRLLETANKEGIYANADIYGQGLLDLDRATRPLGQTRLLTGQSMSGAAAPESLSAVSLGPVFGDALHRGLAGLEIAAFDELDAPFFRPLADYAQMSTVTGTRLENRLGSLGYDPRGRVWMHNGLELRAQTAYGSVQARFDPTYLLRRDGMVFDPWTDHSTGLHGPVYKPVERGTSGLDAGAFSLLRRQANKQLFLGFRHHPGWNLGLHASAAFSGSAAHLVGAFTDDAAFSNPFLSLARDGVTAGFSTNLPRGALSIAAFHGAAQYGQQRVADRHKTSGALAEYRFTDSRLAGVALQAGWLTEPARLAGSRASGAFGELSAATGFIGVSAHRRLSRHWLALVTAHTGISRANMEAPSLLHDMSALWTSAFELGLVGENIASGQDRLALKLSQPLRVESGHVGLRWATGRTRERLVQVETTVLGLEPSGRQLDLELAYSRPWQGGFAHIATLVTHNAGHTHGEEDLALLMRYQRNF